MELTSITTDKLDSCIEALDRFTDYNEIAMCVTTLHAIKDSLRDYVTDGVSTESDWFKSPDYHPMHVGCVATTLFNICDELEEGGAVWELYLVDSVAQIVDEWCIHNGYEVIQE